MKRLALLTLALAAVLPAHAQTNVGVSIGIHQPGVYGRIDIGSFPPPPVVYAQPIVVAPTPVAVYQQPIYLYVPVAYQRDWPRYCGRYRACGQPVYFVQERWVQERYRSAHDGKRGGKQWRRGDDDDRGRDRKRGRGHGKGRGDD